MTDQTIIRPASAPNAWTVTHLEPTRPGDIEFTLFAGSRAEELANDFAARYYGYKRVKEELKL